MLLVSHDLPVASKIKQASAKRPYRALIFSLDLGILRGLYEQVGEAISKMDPGTSIVCQQGRSSMHGADGALSGFDG